MVLTKEIQDFNVLGVPVYAGDMNDVIDRITGWIENRETHYVCAADTNSIVTAQDNPAHMKALNQAAIVTPDGMPLAILGRFFGKPSISRVSGPDLLPALAKHSVGYGWGHYFYGGADGVVEELSSRLKEQNPGLRVAGLETPPFRPATYSERRQTIEAIKASGAKIIWVGLGCPKQEAWMCDIAEEIPGTVMIGVGAAFDFHSGKIKRAPAWMQTSGLEWLHRFAQEPRRLWKRYLINLPYFALAVAKQSLHRQ